MTEMAKKHPIPGLPQMARALNRYYANHKAYPQNLLDLYPTYIPDKSFIENISWRYRPYDDNFLLIKAVATNDRVLAGSIDKSVRPKTQDAMVSAALPQTPTALAGNVKRQKPPPPVVSTKSAVTAAKSDPTDATTDLSAAIQDVVKKIPENTTRQNTDQAPLQAEKTGESIAPPDPPEVLTNLSSRNLMWRDKNGHLGFGNIQYPRKQEIDSVYVGGNWQKSKEYFRGMQNQEIETAQ